MSKARAFWGSLEYHGEALRNKTPPFPLQKSASEVISKRGFKPSDRYDPKKKQFLTDLSTKFWGKSLVSINLFELINFFILFRRYFLVV